MDESQPVTLEPDDPNEVYTKRTRPLIARQSWYVTMAYAGVCVATSIIPGVHPVEFSWAVFMPMATPALFYMGLREIGKWRPA